VDCSSGFPECELVRVPWLMSKDIYNEITIDFLEKCMEAPALARLSLLNQPTTQAVIDYYWKLYQYKTFLFHAPYII